MAVETSISATEIAIALNGTRHGNGWRCESPCCSGRRKAFSVKDAGGRPIFHCFRCNDQDASLAGLRARGLWAAASPKAQRKRRLEAILGDLGHESSVVTVAVDDMLQHRPIEVGDLERARLALRRLESRLASLDTYRPRGRKGAILFAVRRETEVVLAAAHRLVHRSGEISDRAFTRICEANGRIHSAMGACHE